MRKLFKIILKVLVTGLMVALCWAGLLALSLYLDGSQIPPVDPTGLGAERILASVHRAGGKILAPKRFGACEDSLRRARIEMNLQLAGLWGTRNFSRPTRLMDEAQRDTVRLWRDVSAHRTATKASAERAISAASTDLSQAEAVTAVSAQEPYVHARLAAASINLQRSRAYHKDGRYDQALSCALDSIRDSGLAHRRSSIALARYDDPGHLRAWHSWIRQAIEISRQTGGVSFVVIKERHRLEVYRAGKLVKSVPVDLGANSINQKLHAGDRTTPEGLYHITKKKSYGQSKFGMALLLDYPNAEDRRRFQAAKARGELTRRTAIGGLIEIHGEGGKGYDWTDGCIAPDNRAMETLFKEASVGTMVAIVGSDGGDGPVRSALRRAGRS